MRLFSKRIKPLIIVFLVYVCLHPFFLKSRFYQEIFTSSTSSQRTEFIIEYKTVRNQTDVKPLDFDRTVYYPGFPDHVDCQIVEVDKIQSTICGNISNLEQEKIVLGN